MTHKTGPLATNVKSLHLVRWRVFAYEDLLHGKDWTARDLVGDVLRLVADMPAISRDEILAVADLIDGRSSAYVDR